MSVAVWRVWAPPGAGARGGDLVLTMSDAPGALVSTGPRPAGDAWPRHPFLTASAHDAAHEARLRALLDASTDAEDFRARLRAAGYRVERG